MFNRPPPFSTLVASFCLVALAACAEAPETTAPEFTPQFSHVLTTTDKGVVGVFVDYSDNSGVGNSIACNNLGYDFGFKVDNGGGTNVNDTWDVLGWGSVTLDGDGTTWGWSSNFEIDAVGSKGGEMNGGQLYVYNPQQPNTTAANNGDGTWSDSGLQSGFNSSDIPQGLSHADFCWNAGNLDVSKTAETSYTRDHDWAITKTATLAEGADWDAEGADFAETTFNFDGSAPVNYTVDVYSTGYADRDFLVTGTITVENNRGIAASVTSVTDALSDGTTVTVTCPAFPQLLGPSESLTCTYTASPADADNLVNTATADTDPLFIVESSHTTDATKLYGSGYVHGGTGTADVIFGDPTTVLDETVEVSDTYAEFGGTTTATLSGFSHTYLKTFANSTCGAYSSTNTADYLGETGEAGDASFTVTYNVVGCGDPPSGVCTLTQGYWKTHSTYGPAAHPDDTWDLVGGPDALFFTSGDSWYDVFWTSPRGDGYYILAHQYMAAVLNQMNGADTSDIDGTLAAAEALLAGSSPGSLKGKNGATAKELAGILDDYNNGVIGPGHCADSPPDGN